MAMLHKPPPDAYEMLSTFVQWIAGLYRLRITYTILEESGETYCVEVDRRGANNMTLTKTDYIEALRRAAELADEHRATGIAARVGDVRGDSVILRALADRLEQGQEARGYDGKRPVLVIPLDVPEKP